MQRFLQNLFCIVGRLDPAFLALANSFIRDPFVDGTYPAQPLTQGNNPCCAQIHIYPNILLQRHLARRAGLDLPPKLHHPHQCIPKSKRPPQLRQKQILPGHHLKIKEPVKRHQR